MGKPGPPLNGIQTTLLSSILGRKVEVLSNSNNNKTGGKEKKRECQKSFGR